MSIVPRSFLLQPASKRRTAFMCCDIQEKLVGKIPRFMDSVNVTNSFTRMHNALTPGTTIFIATEQYPRGVGHIYHGIQLPEDAMVFAKVSPSMLTPDVLPYIVGDIAKGIEPVQQVVLWGQETHVCIEHTANELLQMGIPVAVAVDGCSAQRNIDHDTAVLAMSGWQTHGLVLTTLIGCSLQLSDDSNVGAVVKAMLTHPPPLNETSAK